MICFILNKKNEEATTKTKNVMAPTGAKGHHKSN